MLPAFSLLQSRHRAFGRPGPLFGTAAVSIIRIEILPRSFYSIYRSKEQYVRKNETGSPFSP